MKEFLQFYKKIIYVVLGLSLFVFLVPIILGYQVYVVETGSMDPTISVGTLIYVKEVETASLKINDIVTFDKDNEVITHRIVGIDQIHHQITTKGDASQYNDPYKTMISDVVGKVQFSIPVIGYILMFIKSLEGIIVSIILLGMFIFSIFI